MAETTVTVGDTEVEIHETDDGFEAVEASDDDEPALAAWWSIPGGFLPDHSKKLCEKGIRYHVTTPRRFAKDYDTSSRWRDRDGIVLLFPDESDYDAIEEAGVTAVRKEDW